MAGAAYKYNYNSDSSSESDPESEEPSLNHIAKTRLNELRAFNWRCVLCNIAAACPMHLENQFDEHFGPYYDMDNKIWVRCAICLMCFHLDCLKLNVQDVQGQRYKCSVFCLDCDCPPPSD